MKIYEDLKKLGIELPVNVGKVLVNFDFDVIFDQRKRIADKDLKRIQGFLPAVYERVAHMSLTVGIYIGRNQDRADEMTINLSQELKQFFTETEALMRMWEDQLKGFQRGDVFGDPTKLEREVTRIYAKRNNLNPVYLEILGVSDDTPNDYPQVFKDRWLV